MKEIRTENGYYRNGDIFSKVVCLPDNANAEDWQLVDEEEYEEWLASQPQALDEPTANAH